MKESRSEKFAHEGVEYDIKLFSDGWKFTVMAFLENKRANGYSYSVDLPTAFDLVTVTGSKAIEVLFDSAKSDLKSEVWKNNVENHINSLNLSESQTLGCQQCTSRDVESKLVDGRKLLHCRACGKVWYAPRSTTGFVEVILDGITDDVANKGWHSADASVLLNTAFREDGRSPSFEDQLKNWCEQNFLVSQDQGNMIMFRRKPHQNPS